uniref:Protein kinase domain-containing protein n=1 Tax=Sparus aurata TaxID=8175 RepID=A0A671WTG3_SPAAU
CDKGEFSDYQVIDFIGEGCFGKVAKCLDLKTYKSVAVKIHIENDENDIKCEVEMLEAIRTLDPEKKNITRFLESFRFNDLSCLAFEILDRSLLDLMFERDLMPMTLSEIRPVIHQLLVAFDALKGISMVHTDLKLDNIMLVNHKDQPYRVKLIDFGLARPVSQLKVGDIMQPTRCRAPEVMLGLRLSEAVDMWGVGHVMAILCFGSSVLKFFSRVEGSSSPGWRLNSPEEYKKATGLKPRLFSVKKCQQCQEGLENEDAMAFLNLLRSCLHLDPSKRLTPKEALKHPFITMIHLVNDKDTNSYADQLKIK